MTDTYQEHNGHECGAFSPRCVAAAWVVLGFGVLFRAVQYAFSRSLWLDEVWLALNIVDRTFLQLFERLDHYQAAPPGFLVLEKAAVAAFGNNEYVLRLFPFVCGVGALFLFYAYAKRHYRADTVLFALLLFAVSRHLVNYASQLKQYSCDLLAAIAITWMAFAFQERKNSWRHGVAFGLLGAVAVWFSHPATLILAGAGGTLGMSALLRRDWPQLKVVCLAGVMWLMGFLPCYLIAFQNLSGNDALINMWGQGFMPFPPTSIPELKWYPKVFFEALENPVGLTTPMLGALMLVVGGVSLFKVNRERFLMLVIPIALMLVASSMRRYPALGRFLLFAVPALMVFLGEGVAQTWRVTRKALPVLGIGVMVVLFARPTAASIYHMYRPYTIQELRAVMPFMEQEYRPGDLVLLHHGARHCFEYYGPKFGLESAPRLVSPRFTDEMASFFDAEEATLRHYRRVWFVFAAVNDDVRVRPLYLERLDRIGTRTMSFEKYGSSLDLYEIEAVSQASP